MSLSSGVVKVLYIEDNEDIARVFAALMRLMVEVKTEVLLAADGQEGVEVALREKPDIIFMDEELPVLDGIEATRRIRACESLSKVPVVMVSAHLSQRDRTRRAQEAGITHWVEKPFEPEDLENALRRALGPQRSMQGRFVRPIRCGAGFCLDAPAAPRLSSRAGRGVERLTPPRAVLLSPGPQRTAGM